AQPEKTDQANQKAQAERDAAADVDVIKAQHQEGDAEIDLQLGEARIGEAQVEAAAEQHEQRGVRRNTRDRDRDRSRGVDETERVRRAKQRKRQAVAVDAERVPVQPDRLLFLGSDRALLHRSLPARILYGPGRNAKILTAL